jgi:hypothetical protein
LVSSSPFRHSKLTQLKISSWGYFNRENHRVG